MLLDEESAVHIRKKSIPKKGHQALCFWDVQMLKSGFPGYFFAKNPRDFEKVIDICP